MGLMFSNEATSGVYTRGTLDMSEYVSIGGRVSRGNFMTSTVVEPDGREQVLKYDLKRLVQAGALLTSLSKGTALTIESTAVLNLLVVVLLFAATLGATLALNWNSPEVLRQMDIGPLKELCAQINALVPFCLLIYLSLMLNRWWALRTKGLGNVFDALANVSMMIACDLHEDKWHLVRSQVAKFGLASVELIMQASRRRGDLDALVAEDLLTEAECEALRRHGELWQRPMICWAWICRISLTALDYNHTPAPRTAGVLAQCIAAREGMAVMNMYLDTQLPFGYVHLVALLVNVQNVAMALKSGIVFAQALEQENGMEMVQQVLSMLVIVFAYQSLLHISYAIADPFAGGILHFPVAVFVDYIVTVVNAQFEAQSDCPVVAQDGTLHRPRHERAAKR